MSDTRLDRDFNAALAGLEAVRELSACQDFEPASELLSGFCLCGWDEASHGVQA